jgi:hypothetical protein
MFSRLSFMVGIVLLALLFSVPLLAQDTGGGLADLAAEAGGEPAVVAEEPAPPTEADKKYDVRLREMEEKIVSMKEKIFATKTRLVLLKERILSNVVSEAWAIIVHKNDMGGAFSLDQVLYYMDGKKKFFMRNKDGILDKQRTIEIFSGSVVPGNHTITVEMVYKGTGKMFTYLQGYKFKITSKYTFYASQGRIVKIQAVGYEKGDFTYSLEDRPAVQFKVSQYKFDKENLAKLTGDRKAQE